MSIQSSINQSLAVAGAYKAMRVRASEKEAKAAEKAAKEAERAAKAEAKAAPTAAPAAPTVPTAAPTPTAPIMQAKPYDQAKAVEALRGAMIQAQSKKALKRAVSEYIVKWREYGKE